MGILSVGFDKINLDDADLYKDDSEAIIRLIKIKSILS